MKIFAITDKMSLRCVYVGLHDSEESAWQVYLGWPGEDEVGTAKLRAVCDEVHCYPVAQMIRT